jgi:amidase
MDTTDDRESTPHDPVHAFDLDLAEMDGVDTARAVASGALSPVEVAEAALARAAHVDAQLHAVVASDPERAIAAARRLDRRGGLAGVPTYIKDMVDVAGYATTWGSPALVGGGAKTATAGIAAQFDDIGMVTLGKSSMSEFGFVPSAEPHHMEPTRNPWNPGHSTGGSSGGAAALVAAGVVPIAHAADGGGSIRIPAACCGLVGLKATRGRLLPHREEQILPVAVTVDGVVTRTVRDTAHWFAEAERRHRNRRLPAMGLVDGPPRRRLRVAAVIELPEGLPVDIEIDEPTRRTFESTIELLESLGHHVELVPAPVQGSFGDDFVAYFELLAYLTTATARLGHGPHVQPAHYSDFTRGMAAGFRSDRGRVLGAARRLRATTGELAKLFGRYDVMLSPVTSTVAPPVGHLANQVPHRELLERVFAWIPFPPIANAAGTPAISLPMGWDAERRLPVGAMFGAATGDDELLLRLAVELEQARPWGSLAQPLLAQNSGSLSGQ